MKQITKGQAIALIKESQNHNLISLDLNETDIYSFHAQMEGCEFAYLCEANISESYSEESNRIGKLLEMLKPEIDSLNNPPRYFQIQILFSQDAMLMMEEMNALNDFLDSYEDIEIKWSLNSVENKKNYVKMQIIIITK